MPMSHSVKQIVESIMRLDKLEDLRLINRAVKERYSNLIAGASLVFKTGDTVYFMSKGTRIRGEVTRVNRKTVMVLEKSWPVSKTWRVSPILLKHEENTLPIEHLVDSEG